MVVGEAQNEWGFVDLTTGRPMKVPQELRDAFTIIEDEGEARAVLEGAVDLV